MLRCGEMSDVTRTTLVQLIERRVEHDLKHTAGGLEGSCFVAGVSDVLQNVIKYDRKKKFQHLRNFTFGLKGMFQMESKSMAQCQ